jgi:hypothetical protein
MLSFNSYEEGSMENDFDLENLENKENFKINPEVWLHTLLAIVGDRDRKAAVVQSVAQKTGFTPEKVNLIITTAIGVLINQTRAN